MIYQTGKTEFFTEGPSAVSIGKFDGLHRGHQKIIGRLLEQKKNGLLAVVFTFEKNPTRILSGLSGKNILTNEERKELLEEAGIDCLLECPFVPEISHMEAEEFAEKVLAGQMQARYVAVGRDCGFGHGRRGDCRMLEEMGKSLGFQTEVISKEQSHGRDISSSYIREALYEGNIPLANELLGYPYFVSGEVLHGRQIGRTLGLPTTNLLPPAEKLLPPNGVYLTRTVLEEGEYCGITNVGYKPTVGGETRKGVETFLFDYSGNLYGTRLKVEFLEFRRPEKKFDSLEALKAQILSDVYWGRNRLKGY